MRWPLLLADENGTERKLELEDLERLLDIFFDYELLPHLP